MKILRRILAVFFLIIILVGVGYLVYSSSRFSFQESDFQEYIGAKYVSENKEIFVIFLSEEKVIYKTDSKSKKADIIGIENKTVRCVINEEEYRFFIVNKDTVYDVQNKTFLWRDIAYGK